MTDMLEIDYFVVVVLSDWLRICCSVRIFLSCVETSGSKARELLTCV
jgi:hypothetical protein